MRTGFALLLALALTAPACAQTLEMKEVTEVGGRSLDQWIKDINHKDPGKAENAIRAVLGFGPEKSYQAMPALLAELRRNTSVNLIDTSLRVNLAITVGSILGAKKDPDPKIVKDAVILLIRLLKDNQGIVKYRAAQALDAIGPESRPATTDLLPLLRDTNSWEVRQIGAATLGRIARDPNIGAPPLVVAALQILLADKAYQVRQAACQSLAALGPPPDPNQRLLVYNSLVPVAKKDPEPTVQIWGQMAMIVYTGKATNEDLQLMTQYLVKGDVSTKIQSAQALGALGPLAKDTVPILIAALSDANADVKGWTIIALGRMESAQAITALQKIADDDKQFDPLKKAAKSAIEQIKKGKGK